MGTTMILHHLAQQVWEEFRNSQESIHKLKKKKKKITYNDLQKPHINMNSPWEKLQLTGLQINALHLHESRSI